jgi:hypothetical protein
VLAVLRFESVRAGVDFLDVEDRAFFGLQLGDRRSHARRASARRDTDQDADPDRKHQRAQELRRCGAVEVAGAGLTQLTGPVTAPAEVLARAHSYLISEGLSDSAAGCLYPTTGSDGPTGRFRGPTVDRLRFGSCDRAQLFLQAGVVGLAQIRLDARSKNARSCWRLRMRR